MGGGILRVTGAPLAGLKLVRRAPVRDERGFFCRLFCAEELAAAGFSGPVAQINQTRTLAAGSVRGLHYQLPPSAEVKLVTCVKGGIYDVCVDLRRGSPTFMRWHAEKLSAENCLSVLVPEGFAHGYQALEAGSEVVYINSRPYDPERARALNVSEPRLAVAWPRPITVISARDAAIPFCGAGFDGVQL